MEQERTARDRAADLEREFAHQKFDYDQRLEAIKKDKRALEDKAQMVIIVESCHQYFSLL